MAFIAPIVEGHAEVDALPALLHRIQTSLPSAPVLQVNPPIRVKSGSFLNKQDEFRRHVQLAASKASARQGSVLILLDCDDDCPAALGPRLLRDAISVRGDVPMFVALAYREYETWFLVAARSLSRVVGLPADLDPPPHPEGLRDAKGWLSDLMPDGYDPIRHQLVLTRHMDLDRARSARSFDRLYRHVVRLLAVPDV
ncbi:MAG TPA: DUF4276 family protein [Rhodopila sp.]|jgi:hypothetical protein